MGMTGVEAALNNYDTEDYGVANAIAVENLQKPAIIKALADAFPDDFLGEMHKKLFEQKRVDYFVFPKTMEDEEIVEHVAAAGIRVITVRTGEKGKMAFYSLPDAQAINNGLEKAYKIKGSYAPEKRSVTIEEQLDLNEADEELLGIINAYYRNSGGKAVAPDGAPTDVVDAQASH